MSSILTNNSAMVALQTLKQVNMNLQGVQEQISTGKSISSAKDNSAVWAISKVMESDVKGFEAISESLSLGESTVAVARNASETVTDLLNDIKGKIVGAQEENVDRAKLQTDIDALVSQIESVTGAAQFNGLNLTAGTEDVNVLASLDRDSAGNVTDSDITIARQDLSYDAGVYGNGASLAGNVTAVDGATSLLGVAGTSFNNGANTLELQFTAVTTATDGSIYNLQIAGTTVSYTADNQAVNGAANSGATVAAGLIAAINAASIEGITAAVDGTDADSIIISSTSDFDDVEINFDSTDAAVTTQVNNNANGGFNTTAGQSFTDAGQEASIAARASTITFSDTAGVTEGDGYRVEIGGVNYDYVAGKGETFEDVARGLKTVIDGAAVADISTNVTQTDAGAWVLQIDNDSATDLTLTSTGAAAGTNGEATGGLSGLDDIDVTTDEGVEAALANIETYINTSIDAAAEFGSAQGRLETQSEFISKLTDSLKSGIGSLVDADMEEASARLQALQVQQQLATQSLSIANQAPQSILSLFR